MPAGVSAKFREIEAETQIIRKLDVVCCSPVLKDMPEVSMPVVEPDRLIALSFVKYSCLTRLLKACVPASTCKHYYVHIKDYGHQSHLSWSNASDFAVHI